MCICVCIYIYIYIYILYHYIYIYIYVISSPVDLGAVRAVEDAHVGRYPVAGLRGGPSLRGGGRAGVGRVGVGRVGVREGRDPWHTHGIPMAHSY